MFHGWMFDPDGDQAAADSTRSSTSLDTGSSLNPRTARRLVTASYTSIVIASVSFKRMQLHHDGALQHIHKRMSIVSVDSARSARRMLDRDHQSFPARILRKILRHE